MINYVLFAYFITLTLSACDKQQEQQVTPKTGEIPKEIIDRATNDLNNANAAAAERLKKAEEEQSGNQ
jgi:hypothetical protein